MIGHVLEQYVAFVSVDMDDEIVDMIADQIVTDILTENVAENLDDMLDTFSQKGNKNW